MLKKSCYKNFKTGFTLIELMIAIAIIGIMSGIAIPNIIGWLPDYRLRNAERGLFGDMQFAKLRAVKSNSDWAIVFDTTNNRYFVCSDKGADDDWSGTNDLTGSGDNTIYKTISFADYKSGVTYGHGTLTTPVASGFGAHNVSYVSENVTFNSRGTGKSGYVYLTNSKGKLIYAIGTNSTGVITTKIWKGSGWI